MARYTGPTCKLARREGVDLELKSGIRSIDSKCKLTQLPGMHGANARRQKGSEYGLQLREKQKVRRIYGILEKQFRKYFAIADRKKGVTGENLLQSLELRFDNVIYRIGLAGSRSAARQLIRHNFFLINGKRVNIPSYTLKKGDIFGPATSKLAKFPIKTAIENVKNHSFPQWLSFDQEKNQGLVQSLPMREDITLPIEEQLIVELYSR